jgi:hypothetical protein
MRGAHLIVGNLLGGFATTANESGGSNKRKLGLPFGVVTDLLRVSSTS